MNPPRTPDNDELGENFEKLQLIVESSSAETRAAIRDLAREFRETYLPREVFELRMQLNAARLIETENDIAEIKAASRDMKRMLIGSGLLPTLVTIIAALILARLL